MEATTAESKSNPGWYKMDGGGRRYWDGVKWTDFVAPPPLQGIRPLRFVDVMLAAAFGVLLAWGVIYLGAQAAPDDVYLPIKFVVEEASSFTTP